MQRLVTRTLPPLALALVAPTACSSSEPPTAGPDATSYGETGAPPIDGGNNNTDGSGSEGNGIVVNGVDGAVVQHNIFHVLGGNVNTCGGAAGVLAYNANNVTIQYNEAYNIRPITFTKGCDWDGFDLDGHVRGQCLHAQRGLAGDRQGNRSHNGAVQPRHEELLRQCDRRQRRQQHRRVLIGGLGSESLQRSCPRLIRTWRAELRQHEQTNWRRSRTRFRLVTC
jgi:hypothetical protein